MNNIYPLPHKTIPYFNFLRFIAMVAIIGIHVISPTLNSYSKGFSATQFSIALFVYSFLSFGTLYAIMELVFTEHCITCKTFFIALKNVYTGNFWDHMWFIYMLIGLYIVTPILKTITHFAGINILRYFLLVLFIFTCIIPLISSIAGTKCGIGIPTTSVQLLYYLLVYSLHFEILKINIIPIQLCLFVSLIYFSLGQTIPNNVELSDFGYKLRYSSPTDVFGIITSISIWLLRKISFIRKLIL